MGFGAAARMGDGAEMGGTDELGIFPERPRIVVGRARLPLRASPGELRLLHLHVDAALLRVDDDAVAVAQQGDWAADRRLRPDMADAEAARGAAEAAIGDER